MYQTKKQISMTQEEIIKGLLLYFDSVEIDVMRASREMGGYKTYKRFDKALNAAYALVE